MTCRLADSLSLILQARLSRKYFTDVETLSLKITENTAIVTLITSLRIKSELKPGQNWKVKHKEGF